MDNFRTEVQVQDATKKMHYDAHLLFIGSCFATNIGSFFKEQCLNADVNPFGVLYNPLSIANSLERLISRDEFTNDEVFSNNGAYHSFFHHSSFNHTDKYFFLENVNQQLAAAANFLQKADYIVITFGSAWVYQHKELNQIVSNCHKYPANIFKRYMIGVQDIVERYSSLLQQLKQVNDQLKFIFTVSPVRHWKDGAHGNQLSKSTLLLAIDQLKRDFTDVEYFPAYEILLDELRDYRFFADDMLHPSDLAVEYIRKKFVNAYFDVEAMTILKRLTALSKASLHRPFNVDSASHQHFVSKQLNKIQAFQNQYPLIDATPLKESFEKQLK